MIATRNKERKLGNLVGGMNSNKRAEDCGKMVLSRNM